MPRAKITAVHGALPKQPVPASRDNRHRAPTMKLPGYPPDPRFPAAAAEHAPSGAPPSPRCRLPRLAPKFAATIRVRAAVASATRSATARLARHAAAAAEAAPRELLAQGRLEEAAHSARRAVELDANDADAWTVLGTVPGDGGAGGSRCRRGRRRSPSRRGRPKRISGSAIFAAVAATTRPRSPPTRRPSPLARRIRSCSTISGSRCSRQSAWRMPKATIARRSRCNRT